MPFFNSGAEGIVLTAQGWVGNRRGGQQHPIILAAVGADFFVDDNIQRHGARGKGLHGFDNRDFGTKQCRQGRLCLRGGFCLLMGKSPLSGLFAFLKALGADAKGQVEDAAPEVSKVQTPPAPLSPDYHVLINIPSGSKVWRCLNIPTTSRLNHFISNLASVLLAIFRR
jgi:hypothetical protein